MANKIHSKMIKVLLDSWSPFVEAEKGSYWPKWQAVVFTELQNNKDN